MSVAQAHHSDSGPFRGDYRSSFGRNHSTLNSSAAAATTTSNQYYTINSNRRNCTNSLDFSKTSMEHSNYHDSVKPEILPSLKRRKFSSSTWENCGRSYNQSSMYDNIPSSCTKIASRHPKISDANTHTSTTCKRDRTKFEDEDVVFMSRDEIERCSPSRKDGIDALQETRLRYSYCAFIQDLGLRVELPQTTIGTAMVLCHRFFVRRSHACHDRFLIASAALFLAAKSEETPCPLNNVLRASCEIFHKQDFNLLFYLLPGNWFEQYRERVIEAEQMILTTLNFELNVQHPYVPLTSLLDKLGLSQTFLVNLALSLVSEGVYRRLACMPV